MLNRENSPASGPDYPVPSAASMGLYRRPDLKEEGLPVAGFGYPRDFQNNRFVYLTVSPRARGLSIGINFNPDQQCNFDCAYCEVRRDGRAPKIPLDVGVMAGELKLTLNFVRSGELRQCPPYHALPAPLLELRHVALSGDGEPTQCPNFGEAVQTVVHVRASGKLPFFKIVLLTNATGLDLPEVGQNLKLLTASDEIWVKLDAGTQAYLDRINQSRVPLKKILANLLQLARQRPVVIQSLFAQLNGQEPPPDEIQQYLERLRELKKEGAMISLVQVYSPTRPMAKSECGHLPLKSLSNIARTIRISTGLPAEVF